MLLKEYIVRKMEYELIEVLSSTHRLDCTKRSINSNDKLMESNIRHHLARYFTLVLVLKTLGISLASDMMINSGLNSRLLSSEMIEYLSELKSDIMNSYNTSTINCSYNDIEELFCMLEDNFSSSKIRRVS